MKVVVLTGGGGGVRFLRGVVAAVDPASVTAIVNVGDALEILGLSVSPDLDSALFVSAMVRGARTSRSRRQRPLRGGRGGTARGGRARGASRGRCDPHRAEQSIRLDRTDPGSRTDPACARASPCPVPCRQSADR